MNLEKLDQFIAKILELDRPVIYMIPDLLKELGYPDGAVYVRLIPQDTREYLYDHGVYIRKERKENKIRVWSYKSDIDSKIEQLRGI